MRILYDFQVFQIQQFGGISRYIVEVSSRIAASGRAEVFVFKGFHRSLVTWNRSASSIPKNMGVRIGGMSSGLKAISGINYAWFSLFQTFASKVDILHLTYYPRTIINRKQAALVVSLYDMIPETFPALYVGDPIIARRKEAFHSADIILSISESSKNDLLRFYQIEPTKIRVVHLASSLPILLEDDNSIEVSAIRYSGKPFVLYVGVRAAYKNFIAVLNAFGSDPLLHGAFELWCFGSVPFSEDEKRHIAELHLEDTVKHIVGDDDVLRECYRNASALVYPSLYEGFGIPLVEAMNLGCPVAASDRGSIPEVLADAGILFDPTSVEDIARAMKVILFDEERRRTCILKGIERGKTFSWEKTAELTLAAYNQAIQ